MYIPKLTKEYENIVDMSATPVTIGFKLTSGDYGFLTNFYKKGFMAEGVKWRTSEHYYQWRKLKFLQSIGEPVSDEYLQAVIDAKTAKATKILGHKRCNNVDKWDAIKVDEMKLVISEKFKDDRLRQKLLDTGDANLVERSYYDAFWGDGNGRGLNMLGRCLMELRQQLADA